MKDDAELNRNDIVTCWMERGYYIVVNPEADEDSFSRPMVTIKKVMTSKLLKRVSKQSYTVEKMSVNPVPREEMFAMIEKGKKRLNDAEKFIREFQI